MFFLNNRNISIFCVIAALMLWANVGMTQTEWEKYPGNPVLNLGAHRTWDDVHVFDPTVLFDGKKYQMWYHGHDGSNVRIGYATSADGIVWVKHPDNPVLNLGASGTWDDADVGDPTVLFDGTEYQMWYDGNDGSHWRIGYATSADGIVWVKHPDNPVLDIGASGTWDDSGVYESTVLFDGTKYQMWYSGYGGSTVRIGYATSTDGIVWVKHPGNPVLDIGASGTWDDVYVRCPTVLFDGTKYQIWYAGHDGSNYRIGYATSTDGIVWVKYPGNPVLDLGESGIWDDAHVAYSTVLLNRTEYQMWYSGFDGSNYRIGYATSAGAPDTIPPSSIADLVASSPTSDSITLTWTAPGDDGDVGTASQYDIRYSTSPIDEGNWDSATQAVGEPAPSTPGTEEIFTVPGLSPDTTYYFAMKTADEVPNWSGLSNVVCVNLLLAQYEPILYLHPSELFLPMNVEAFVGSCSLWKNNPFPSPDEEKIGDGKVTLNDLDLGADQKDYFLKFVQNSLMPTIQDLSPKDIIPPELRLYMQLLTIQAIAEYNKISDEKIIYYARKTEDAGYIVLQYWFFYAYNSWGMYPGFRAFSGGANVHEGDWEMISIFLKPGADKPEYAAYSAHHDSGSKVTMLWDNVPKEPQNGHPIVYVALGSHASYFKSGLIPREMGFLDITSDKGKHIGPGQDKWETPFIIDDASLPVWIENYAGNWGINCAIDKPVLNGFSGPQGPAFQGDKWEHPVTWAPPPETAVAIAPLAVAFGNVPVKNILSQNYPNPFNPDTWIPFELASSTEVTIHIYNTKGQLVRTLRLGNQNAGIYLTKDKAAYWDGKDSLGEKVASGVYFYNLRAGDFTAVRKMILLK